MKKSSLLMVFIFLSSGYFTFITNYENENSFSSDSEISYSGQTKSYEWKADTIGSVIAIATSEDGKYVVAVTQGVWNSSASMSDSSTIYLFENSSNIPLWQHTLSSFGGFTDVAISQNGDYIAAVTAHGESSVYFWNRNNSVPTWVNSTGENMASISMSDNGSKFVVGSYSGNISLFSMNSNIPSWSNNTVGYHPEISSDGTKILSTYGNKTFLFDSTDGAEIWSNTDAGSWAASRISRDGTKILIATSSNYYLFDSLTKNMVQQYSLFGSGSNGKLSISNDGSRWVAGGDSGVALYNSSSPNPEWINQTPESLNGGFISISADGERMTAGFGGQGSNHGTVYFWNTSFGSNIIWSNEFSSNVYPHYGNALSASGKHAYYGGQPGKIYYFLNDFQPVTLMGILLQMFMMIAHQYLEILQLIRKDV